MSFTLSFVSCVIRTFGNRGRGSFKENRNANLHRMNARRHPLHCNLSSSQNALEHNPVRRFPFVFQGRLPSQCRISSQNKLSSWYGMISRSKNIMTLKTQWHRFMFRTWDWLTDSPLLHILLTYFHTVGSSTWGSVAIWVKVLFS
jgi:hypothetical protein